MQDPLGEETSRTPRKERESRFSLFKATSKNTSKNQDFVSSQRDQKNGLVQGDIMKMPFWNQTGSKDSRSSSQGSLSRTPPGSRDISPATTTNREEAAKGSRTTTKLPGTPRREPSPIRKGHSTERNAPSSGRNAPSFGRRGLFSDTRDPSTGRRQQGSPSRNRREQERDRRKESSRIPQPGGTEIRRPMGRNHRLCLICSTRALRGFIRELDSRCGENIQLVKNGIDSVTNARKVVTGDLQNYIGEFTDECELTRDRIYREAEEACMAAELQLKISLGIVHEKYEEEKRIKHEQTRAPKKSYMTWSGKISDYAIYRT